MLPHGIIAGVCTVSIAASAYAQECGSVSTGFPLPGVDQGVYSSVVWDDGSGPALYIGGNFRSVGGVAARSVARFDGSAWTSVGADMTGTSGGPGLVWDLEVHNGALYAAGFFNSAGGVAASNVARFDGTTWSALPGGGTDGTVYALASFQGSLYLGGFFGAAGGVSTPRIARFDGSTWSYPAGGPYNDTVYALHVWDSGAGAKLFAGGGFVRLGNPSGPYAHGIASYDGVAWLPLGSGTGAPGNASTGRVTAIESFDAGGGQRLYIGGYIAHAGGLPVSGVASWNGSSWIVEPGLSGGVDAFSVHDDGAGARLYAAGSFALPGTTPTVNVARLEGGAWTSIDGGVGEAAVTLNSYRGELFVGGTFVRAGSQAARGIARLTSGVWLPVSTGFGLLSAVKTFCVFDSGSGPELYVGTEQLALVPTGTDRFLRWTGAGWTAPGLGLTTASEVSSSAVWDDGTGPALYVAGTFSAIGGVPALYFARWNGTSWSSPSAQPSGQIRSLRTLDDGSGPVLYAANIHLNPSQHGVPSGNYVARWTGAAWQPLGPPFDADVLDLAAYDAGAGPRIYATGEFTAVGGASIRYIAQWNASSASWQSIGVVDNPITAMHVHDDGSGAQLYVGGYFASAGGVAANHVARWNGSTWSAVGAGLGTGLQNVEDLVAHDDGTGRKLYATGNFDVGSVRGLAAWDGSTWTAVHSLVPSGAGSGALQSTGRSLASFDDGSGAGPALWVSGDFTRIDATVAGHIGRIDGCHGTGVSYCAGDGSGAPCPCNNESAPGSGTGCVSSIGVGGRLDATGVASVAADTYVLAANSMPGTSTALYFSGTASVNAGAGQAFGDGLRCVGGTVRRLGAVANVAGASTQPNVAQPTPLSLRDPVLPGAVRDYQVWYRNAASFCTDATFNLTNAWRVVWIQ